MQAVFLKENEKTELENGTKKLKGETMIFATLKLNMRLQPMHRHDIEDILQELLEEKELGEVDGGGTAQQPDGEIQYCDIDLSLHSGTDRAKAELLEVIGQLALAKGSALLFGEEEIPVGTKEGMACYLNGTELPDEVYANCDINYAIGQMEKAMEGIGWMFSYWQGPKDTALYFYGTTYEDMKKCVEPFMAEYPLCQKARLEQIA